MSGYVNYRGEEIGLISHPVAPKVKPAPAPFHKGWRVQGIPPEALAAARDACKHNGLKWDRDAWLMNAKAKPVRSKPYSLHTAANECAELAKKAGWLRVEVVEVRRGEAERTAC